MTSTKFIIPNGPTGDKMAEAAVILLLTELMRQTGTKEVKVDLNRPDSELTGAIALHIDREKGEITAQFTTGSHQDFVDAAIERGEDVEILDERPGD